MSRALWSFVSSALCAILAAIDLERFARTGSIVVGRESQVLSGFGARATIAVFVALALGFFAHGVYRLGAAARGGASRSDDPA